VTERVGLMKRVRDLAVACAKAYVESRERLGFPLLAPAQGPPEGAAAPDQGPAAAAPPQGTAAPAQGPAAAGPPEVAPAAAGPPEGASPAPEVPHGAR
jgi:hypothetical protein